MASVESPPLPRARPPPPPNPFVVLERDFLQTELGKQSLAAWGVIQSALAPWVRSASEALQPALRTVNEVLLLPIANALALEPTDGEFSPVVSVVVPVLMLIGLGFLMRQLVKRWDRRAHHHKRNPFAARGTVADAEAKGEQPLLGMNSSRSDKSPRGRFAFGAGVRDRTTKDVPEIRIGLPSGTPAPGGPLPPMTARGGPDSSRSSSGGGRFMPAFDPASEAMQSSRSLRSARGHPPRSEKQLPAKSPRNSAMMRPDWLDAVGRGGPHHCGPTEGETPRLMRPSTTPRQALSTSTPRGAGGNEGILTASAAANTNSWFWRRHASISERCRTERVESLSYLRHRSGRSTPRIDTLMSSTPRGVVSWQEINPHHRLTIAFEPFPAMGRHRNRFTKGAYAGHLLAANTTSDDARGRDLLHHAYNWHEDVFTVAGLGARVGSQCHLVWAPAKQQSTSNAGHLRPPGPRVRLRKHPVCHPHTNGAEPTPGRRCERYSKPLPTWL